jgi:sugar phosphate permease
MPSILTNRWARVLAPLLALYVINFIDRNNIGFAVIGGMNTSLHLGPAASGLSGGIFYLGYSILQIPSGILVEKFDANKLIMLFAVAWGVVALATGFVQNGYELLALRFLLGLIDGGVWTMILVVLARWFPGQERATANSIWLTCLPISFIIMGPISGLLIAKFDWRALFIIEAVPAIILGILYFAVSASRPEEASWLSPAERNRLLAAQPNNTKTVPQGGYRQAMLNRSVLLMSATYFFWLVGAAGVFMWIPAIIKELSTQAITETGLLSTLPYFAALAGLLVIGRISDRTGNRAKPVYVSLFFLGVFLLLSVFSHNAVVSLAFLICAGTFLFSPHAPFWAIPAEMFAPNLRGAAMGMISLIGNVGAFIGPFAVGYVRQETGSFSDGIFILVGSLWIAAFLATRIKRQDSGAANAAQAVHIG